MSHEDAARIENEMGKLGREFRLIEESYGRHVLTLVVYVAYLRKLLENATVLRYLSKRYADLLAEFQEVVEASDLVRDA